MSWTSSLPDGSQSVAANRNLIGGNFTYTETTLGNIANNTTNSNSVPDHYWNQGAPYDGRHRYVNMPAYTIGSVAADPVLGSGMGATLYARVHSATESPGNQDVGLFLGNLNGASVQTFMQLIGIRAAILFDVVPNGNPSLAPTCTVNYSYNATLAAGALTPGGQGVDKTFTVNFTNALPTAKYMVFGGGIGTAFQNPYVYVNVPANAVPSTVKSVNLVKCAVVNSGLSNPWQPVQVWLICMGG